MNISSEGTNNQTPREGYFLQCSRCQKICCFTSIEEVMFDEQADSIFVRLDEQASYCSKCLELQIQQEILETRVLEERFIYYKQFQSSFEERQLQRHLLHQKNSTMAETEREEIITLQQQEKQLNRELNQLKQVSGQLKEQLHNLELEEEKFWEGINRIERRTNKVEQKSLNTKFDKLISKNTLDQLSRMSILHLFLDIRVDDNCAYIQGMSMGKRSENTDISWEQVSIGLGHLLIGINFLAIKYSYQYRRIESIAFKGNYAEIVSLGKKRLCTNYTKQSERSFGELLQILLLETFFLSEHILEAQNIEYSQQFKIPFIISSTEIKVLDLPIDPLKIEERNRWTNWTKAMRYFLIDFRHIITVYAINDKIL